MQNFDFSSLYDEAAKEPDSNGFWYNIHTNSSNPHGKNNGDPMSQGIRAIREENSGNSQEIKKKKKVNRLITLFVVSIVLAFTFGLVTGIKLTASSNKDSQLIDSHTRAFFNTTSQSARENNTSDKEGDSALLQKSAKGSYAKRAFTSLYIKIFPSLPASKAQKLARALLKNKFSVHYSQLDNGNYFLYTGPFKKEKMGLARIHQMKSMAAIQKIKGRLKLVER